MRDYKQELIGLAKSGDLEAIRRLFEDIPADILKEIPSFKNEYGDNAIHIASANNHTHVVQFLLDNGFSAHEAGWGENTPLHWAAMRGSVDLIRLLLANGSRFSEDVNHEGLRTIDYAVCNTEVVKAFAFEIFHYLGAPEFYDYEPYTVYKIANYKVTRQLSCVRKDASGGPAAGGGGRVTKESEVKDIKLEFDKIDIRSELLPDGSYLPLAALEELYCRGLPSKIIGTYHDYLGLSPFFEYSDTRDIYDYNNLKYFYLFQLNSSVTQFEIVDRRGNSISKFIEEHPMALCFFINKELNADFINMIFPRIKGEIVVNPLLICHFSDRQIASCENLEEIIIAYLRGEIGFPELIPTNARKTKDSEDIYHTGYSSILMRLFHIFITKPGQTSGEAIVRLLELVEIARNSSLIEYSENIKYYITFCFFVAVSRLHEVRHQSDRDFIDAIRKTLLNKSELALNGATFMLPLIRKLPTYICSIFYPCLSCGVILSDEFINELITSKDLKTFTMLSKVSSISKTDEEDIISKIIKGKADPEFIKELCLFYGLDYEKFSIASSAKPDEPALSTMSLPNALSIADAAAAGGADPINQLFADLRGSYINIRSAAETIVSKGYIIAPKHRLYAFEIGIPGGNN